MTTHLPWNLLLFRMPLKHFPVNQRTAEHVYLFIVVRLSLAELRCLPVDRADQAVHHRPCKPLNLGEAKIREFRPPLGADEDIGRLAVAMNNGRGSLV